MPMPELHTAPALSRLCGIFLKVNSQEHKLHLWPNPPSIANYSSLSSFQLGILKKLQRKALSQSEKREWFIILMVDFVGIKA